jgi:hypothetical protein
MDSLKLENVQEYIGDEIFNLEWNGIPNGQNLPKVLVDGDTKFTNQLF